MSSVQMRFEEEGFQIEFEREQTWSIAERLGKGRGGGEGRGGGIPGHCVVLCMRKLAFHSG